MVLCVFCPLEKKIQFHVHFVSYFYSAVFCFVVCFCFIWSLNRKSRSPGWSSYPIIWWVVCFTLYTGVWWLIILKIRICDWKHSLNWSCFIVSFCFLMLLILSAHFSFSFVCVLNQLFLYFFLICTTVFI